MKRVVVTGMGLVTPLGCGVNLNWKNLISGTSGIKKISKFDVSKFKCQIASEVPQEENIKGSFIAEEWIEKKDIKKYDEFLKFSLAAGEGELAPVIAEGLEASAAALLCPYGTLASDADGGARGEPG